MKTTILFIILLCCSAVYADPRQRAFTDYKRAEKRQAIKLIKASQNPNAYAQLIRDNQYQLALYRSYLASQTGRTINVQLVR